MVFGEKISIENIDKLVSNHMPFIIRTLANLTGRYISIENDEVFSIGLSAFVESVERYDEERGNFLSFARLVIESRVKTYLIKENKRIKTESLEELMEKGHEIGDSELFTDTTTAFQEEVDAYKQELLKFGLTLEDLADRAPKHGDTKANAVEIARIAGDDRPTVEMTYKKRKLPIRAVARIASVTEKVVKGSKTFILSAMLIFANNLPELTKFLLKRGAKHVL